MSEGLRVIGTCGGNNPTGKKSNNNPPENDCGGNNRGNNKGPSPQVFLTKQELKIYELLTKERLCATGGKHSVQRTMKFKSRATVSKKIQKFLKLGIIICISGRDKVKFYRAVPGIHILSGNGNNRLLLRGKALGGVPKTGGVVYIRRRNSRGRFIKSKKERLPWSAPRDLTYDSVVHKDGQMVKICKKHNISFITSVKGDLKAIPWTDGPSTPNGRFTFYGMHMNVPGVGYCAFRWDILKDGDMLRIWLPKEFVLPHELNDDNIDAVGWKAASLFSKRFHLGVGILERSSESYAFKATKRQEEFLDKHGPIKVKTATGGYAEIDESEKPYKEQEVSSLREAQIIASDLGLPGQIALMERTTDDIKEWIDVFQKNFQIFLKADHDLKLLSEKQWEEQKKFNTTVRQFMETQETQNKQFATALMESRMRLLGQKQTKLDQFREVNEIGYV